MQRSESEATAALTRLTDYDFRRGDGRPKPLVAKHFEADVLPQITHVDPTQPLGAEYFQEVAALTRLAGWTGYDIGEHGLAQRYLYHAFRLARAAGDKPLRGRILAGMSHQANFLGHYKHAVHLARAVHGHATATTMALFRAMEARALASQRNEPENTVALTAAEQWTGQSNPANDPSWIGYFDHAELHAEFTHCFRDLGDGELANHHAAASIDASESLYVRSLSFCRTVLATSHLRNDEVEQAVHVVKGVVDTAAHLKSYRVVCYLDELRDRLEAHADGQAVRELGEYLAVSLPSVGRPAPGRLLVA